ncbi:hypothetical protein [Arcobacter sp. s6]|uniref:hypothetical protein n=1 Tax=Arcobacter sp. s6 TaxID=3230363 RepID=UPI00349FE44D
MGIFDVQINKKIKLRKTNKDLFEFIKKRLLKDKDYENEITREELSIKKCHINTLLKYNLSAKILSNKKESTLQIDAELQDTLIIAIVIILAIVLTYGLGVILVVAYVYYQKVIATKYLNSLIENYQTIN